MRTGAAEQVDSHAGCAEELGGEVAERVVSDDTGDVDGASTAGKIDGDIRGTAPEGEGGSGGEDELAGSGKSVDRFADVVGDDDSGAEAVESGCVHDSDSSSMEERAGCGRSVLLLGSVGFRGFSQRSSQRMRG